MSRVRGEKTRSLDLLRLRLLFMFSIICIRQALSSSYNYKIHWAHFNIQVFSATAYAPAPGSLCKRRAQEAFN